MHVHGTTRALRTLLVCVLPLAARSALAQEPERQFATREGGTGGLSVVSAGGAMQGSFRLQLALEAAPADDFLERGNEVTQTRKSIAFSWTALASFELYASLHDRDSASAATSIAQTRDELASLHLTRALLGMKLWSDAVRYLKLGGDVRLLARGDAGSELALLKATSIGLRAIATTDLRDLPGSKVPLLARFNAEYLFDNGARAVENTEEARYRELTDPAPRRDETRQLVSPRERYGLDINRVDRFTVALGLEAPLQPAERLHVHPLVEWQLGVPVNRQSYDCPAPADPVPGDDACLGDVDAVPMSLVLGARIAPPVRGLSFLLALEADLTAGGDNRVRELAPVAPFLVTLAVGYDG